MIKCKKCYKFCYYCHCCVHCLQTPDGSEVDDPYKILDAVCEECNREIQEVEDKFGKLCLHCDAELLDEQGEPIIMSDDGYILCPRCKIKVM